MVDWVRAHEIPLATVEPGHGFADLAPLRAIVGDARVVGLGEATHGTREIFRLKHRILEYLVSEMGFTVLAIETGLPESFAIDDYVLGGPGDPEQLLAAESAVWRTEELRDVVRWMREWNRTHTRKVHFQGLDMRRGAVAARETHAYLECTDPAMLSSPSVRAFAHLADPAAYLEITRRPKPELAALAAQARELVAWFESQRAQYVARSGAESWWRAAMQARVLAQRFEWLAADDMRARVLVRERAMADNALRALEHRGPGTRAVVWAHNAHIAGDREADPPMMGVHLRVRLGSDYRAIGSTTRARVLSGLRREGQRAEGLSDRAGGPWLAREHARRRAAGQSPSSICTRYQRAAWLQSGSARSRSCASSTDCSMMTGRRAGRARARSWRASSMRSSFVAVGTVARKLPALPPSPGR